MEEGLSGNLEAFAIKTVLQMKKIDEIINKNFN
ncbi:hypothetical protein CMTB2_00814 [Caminibacter mediatlanticus TB-2]|uniref:Uncharacterized protein n=1 Tax=Caminibacter mediatlanticus TB-2 TaxID=391592 RepID=A0AAI9F2F9_9BACT|nr:hypothetical protein CMTB2_00814 [Caminibacter mediatlanticus TB-2]